MLKLTAIALALSTLLAIPVAAGKPSAELTAQIKAAEAEVQRTKIEARRARAKLASLRAQAGLSRAARKAAKAQCIADHAELDPEDAAIECADLARAESEAK